MQRARLMLATTLLLTVVAGVSHYTLGKAAGAYVSALPLVLVAPIIAIGCDSLRGRLSASMLGIVQSAFGNIAEFALTLLALSANLPDVVRVAIAGSILGNALLLGGIAGLIPTIRERGRNLTSLKFERHLFSSIATLAVVAVVPIGILSFGTGNELGGKAREDISLAAGIGLLLIGGLFLLTELRKESPPEDPNLVTALSGREAVGFLAAGGVVAALTSDWFVAGFQPAVHDLGMPTAFAALVIVPLLGNIAENYVALRYAWSGDGDGAMAVIMHSVVQIATLMTGALLIASWFIGDSPLTLQYGSVVAIALVLSLIVLWIILQDGELEPVEALALLVIYAVLATSVWVERVA
ncbi:MAG: Ca2+:H+ antiporter [Gaiellales bacterium]|jgi:Ca2+:H+ antiporter|nr:Ca2+:H+ antiporter [Gaiellales bacterium]